MSWSQQALSGKNGPHLDQNDVAFKKAVTNPQ
jgi:hypothetical protein